MKRLAFIIGLSVCCRIVFSQAITCIKGSVRDESGQPLPSVNVYIKGSLDGASTDDEGMFSLTTDARGAVTLIASFIGYLPFSVTGNVEDLGPVDIILEPEVQNLNEVVVYAGNYQLKSSSTINRTNAVDLVSVAGSEGDLFKAISMLPGTQASGRDGRLLVRGGTSRESQTYIDDMHVLSPYTPAQGDVGSRSRYSPFLFEGLNFSMGGYVPEYSQSLSAVLPLYTRDETKTSKLGVDMMNVSVGGGGTQSWRNGSASFNVNYTDLGFYNTVFFPSLKPRWKEPYRQISGQNQFRFTLGKETYLKTYLGYDRTRFVLIETAPFTAQLREMDFGEDNVYINTTFRKKFDSRLTFFSGAAFSFNQQKIDNARTLHDAYAAKEHEIHLKTKAEKRLSDLYKITVGAEAFFKEYGLTYTDTTTFDTGFKQTIAGLFVSNDFNLTADLFLNLSSRIEYTSLSGEWGFLPRVAFGYKWRDLTISGILGRYQQNAANDVLIYNRFLLPEKNTQALIGIYYQKENKILRVEAYHKKYDHLPLNPEGNVYYSSDGYGYSKGIDFFFNDTHLFKHWEYMLAYSYNDSRRKYLDFPEAARPSYAMRHNASMTVKYTNFSIRSIISISNRFASGRPYHDPNLEGFVNASTPVYNSLDASWIFLAHKRLIVYTGFSNILNRKNVYGYVFDSGQNGPHERMPLTQQINQGFYIGCFISLGKNAAYNTSNFY